MLLVLLTSCIEEGSGKYTGGGWIPSAAQRESKATFGFNIQALDTDGDGVADDAKGQVQYRDRAAEVSLHGVVEAAAVDLAATPPVGYGAGTYTPQPKKAGQGGSFLISVQDNGEPGPSSDDWVEVYLEGGVYDGYINGQFLGGGNVQYHAPKEAE